MKTLLIDELICPSIHSGSCCQGQLYLDDQLFKPRFQSSGKELQEGILTCQTCNQRYPVISGVAIVLNHVFSWLRANHYYIVSGAATVGGISEAMTDWLTEQGWHLSNRTADNYYETPRWINIFTATHYDTTPAGADDHSPLGKFIASQPGVFEVTLEILQQNLVGKVKYALDIGTNVGGMAAKVASLADNIYGIDVAFNPILTARRLQCGCPLPQTHYRCYMDGHHYESRSIAPMLNNTEFLVGSAAHLPLKGRFGLVTALNVIDSVPNPREILKAATSALEDNGYLLVTSPYSWTSDDVPVDNWLGGKSDDPSPQALIRELTELGLEVITERDHVPWVLREHQRWYRVFLNHCVLARKRSNG